MKPIAYYITAHGYGHGTRSCDIINALHAIAPDLPIRVKTDLPVAFMQSRLPAAIKIIPGAFDIGLIQKDSIHVDLEASLCALEELYSQEETLMAQEVDFIRHENIGLVVADIPAIPLAAARQANVTAVATGNFGWDWIYSDFIQHDPRWKIYIEKFSAVYQQTDLLLRQPFAEPMSAFPKVIDLPLLAKPGRNRRAELAEHTGADSAKKWILISFTTLNLGRPALEKISQLGAYEFLTVEPLYWPDSGIHCIDRSVCSFADALASVDLVITKPGFGIVSECIANAKPIIYTDRKDFLEYPLLVEGIKHHCQHAFIASSDLYSGNLAPAIEAIQTAPLPTQTMPRGGAEIAAELILEQLS